MTTEGLLRPPHLVLFDLDGTLVDSVDDLNAAANATLAALSRPTLPRDRVRAYVGNGIDRLIHRCLTGEMDTDAEPLLFQRAHDEFMDHYAAHNGRHTSIFPGALDGLRAAAEHGAYLGCVTNKSARFTEPLLTHLNLRDRFQVVVSGDTTAHCKPHPAPLLHAARALAVEPLNTVMVGDSISDVRAARAAGMPVVCVAYGYNHGEDIRQARPDAVFESLSELDAWLANG